MARVNRMMSDLTGVEEEEEKFGTLVFRRGAGIESALALDVLPSEVEGLEEAKDIYVLGIKMPGDYQERQLVVSAKELTSKIVPKDTTLDALLENARFLRGKRPNGR